MRIGEKENVATMDFARRARERLPVSLEESYGE